MRQQRKTGRVKLDEAGGRFVEDVDRIDDHQVSAAVVLARAVALHLDGKRREALAELNRAVDAGTAIAEIYSARGHVQFELERYDDAVNSYKRLQDLEPDHPSAAFNLGVCLERMERWGLAAEKFQEAVERDPKRVGALTGLGVCLLRTERAAEALTAFERCLEEQPDHANALFGKAVALQLTGQPEGAIVVYRKILEADPASEEARINLIGIGIARQDEALTREQSEQLLAIRPYSPAAVEGLASCAFWSGDYEAAVQFCTKLVELDSENYERRFNLGVAHQRVGHLEQSAKAYQEAVRLKPEAVQARVNLGIVRHELGDHKGASSAYEAALKQTPDLPVVRYNLALLLEQQGATFEAENYYEQLLAEHPDWADAWFRLGFLRLQRSHYLGAIEAFEKCLERQSPWPQAHVNLGLAYWRNGDHEAAGRAFEAAIEADTESIDAMRGLAALAIEQQDYNRALDLQARLIDRGERSPELFYNTGLLLHKTGQTGDAIKLYREAVADKPDFAEALLNLGHALKDQGHPDEARVYWSQALAANPKLAQGYFDGQQVAN